ncbi:S4 domain-containing protein [Buchnera aphidicola]|uniref:S4 domain-containing protein n=1 Tax=Buchnera aphidicola TaxID=9 RepID=UPI0002F3645E|nr:S4 domain-containing protein [Buchnera aphidicola]
MSNLKKINFIVPKLKEKSIRLDKILVKHLNSFSRSSIKKWILSGFIKVNNITANKPKKKFYLKIEYLL